MAIVTLITSTPRSLATGAPVTVRMAGGGTRAYHHKGEHWRAGVAEIPRFRSEVQFEDRGWTGGVVPATGPLVFAPGRPGDLAELAALFWMGAPIVVEDGEETGTSFAVRLTGAVREATIVDGRLVLTIADLGAALDKPLLVARFAGTGGVEGGADAAGAIKRRSFGRVFNVEGRLRDKANNIFEFGDPAFPLQAFDVVRDGGRAGVRVDLAWQGSAAATDAALVAAVAPQGGCVAAPSIGCVKWWTAPRGPLTADIRGEVGAGYVETAPELAARVLAAANGPAIANASAMSALRAGVAGIHAGTETDTVASLLDRLLLGVSLLWILEPSGVIRLREFGWGPSAGALRSEEVSRRRTLPPVRSRRVGYRKSYRVHADGDIVASLLQSDPAAAAKLAGIADGATVGATTAEAAAITKAQADIAAATQTAAATKATAETAARNAEAANARITDTATDSKLSGQEKLHQAIPDKEAIDASYAIHNASADAYGVSKTAHVAAYDELGTYLVGLRYTDHRVDDAISRTAYIGKWRAYYAARDTMLKAIAAETAKRAEYAKVSGTPTTLGAINSAEGQKLGGVEAGATVGATAAQANAIAQTQAEVQAAATAATNARSAADAAAGQATAANARIDETAADGKLSGQEKLQKAIPDKEAIDASYAVHNASAAAFGIDTAAHTAAFNALGTYLASVRYTNHLVTDAVNRVTYKAKWTDYFNARDTMLKAISAEAAKRADYAKVSGTPTTLGAINATEGQKLGSVAAGADRSVKLLPIGPILPVITGAGYSKQGVEDFNSAVVGPPLAGTAMVGQSVANPAPFYTVIALDDDDTSFNYLDLKYEFGAFNSGRVFFRVNGVTKLDINVGFVPRRIWMANRGGAIVAYVVAQTYSALVHVEPAAKDQTLWPKGIAYTPGAVYADFTYGFYSAGAEPNADVTVNQPVVAKLNPVTGKPTSSLFFFTAAAAGLKKTNTARPTASLAADGTATINIPAHDQSIPGATGKITRSYAAATIPGKAAGTYYTLYLLDPDFTGGVKTILATIDPDDANQVGALIVGNVLTPTAAGTTTTGAGGNAGTGSGTGSGGTSGGTLQAY